MAKLNIGDKAWYAAREYNKVYVKCPDCLGSGNLTVRFADGKEVSIACATCAPAYDPPTGVVSYYQYQTKVREVTICGADIRKDKTEYRFDYNLIADESEFFLTKEEAEKKAKELSDKATLSEMNALNSKEKPTRTWAWNASYYRSRLKNAKRDVEIYEAKLSVAKIKAKGGH